MVLIALQDVEHVRTFEIETFKLYRETGLSVSLKPHLCEQILQMQRFFDLQDNFGERSQQDGILKYSEN